MPSRFSFTRTIISTVLPLPFDPTRPIVGFFEPTKSSGSAVWQSGQARRFASPPHSGQMATGPTRATGPPRPFGGMKVLNVLAWFPVSLILASSVSLTHGALPRPDRKSVAEGNNLHLG